MSDFSADDTDEEEKKENEGGRTPYAGMGAARKSTMARSATISRTPAKTPNKLKSGSKPNRTNRKPR